MSVLPTEALAADAAALPPLQLLPPPPCEPPYDDELPGARPLRLVPGVPLVAPARRPRPPAPARDRAPFPAPPPLRLVGAAERAGDPALDDDDLPVRTPRSELPSPRPFAHALVQRLLEVLAGVRPVSQLQRDTSVELFEQLEQVLHARPRATGLRPSARSVRSVHVQERPDGVAEVCATVSRGGRAGALAFRLEGRRGAWQCTELVGV